MDAPTPPLISSFIIRFVVDETSAEIASYHGTVRHIQTAQEVSFTEWREATEFMRRFVQLDELQPPSSPDPITNLYSPNTEGIMRNVQILSTGSYVPERVVTNAEVDALMGESTSEWLLANVGIKERRWMAPDQVTSDLIVEASKKALERAGITAADLDLIIVSTDTPDYLSPSTSIVVQNKLGADKAGCYDINSACAGWVTALDQGAKYLMTEPQMKYVLVAGGYGMSRFLDFTDKKTANLFADGAGAVVLGFGEKQGFLGSNLLAVGSFHDALGIYTGGTYRPCTPENMAQFGAPKVEFVKKFPKTFNTEYWPKLMQGALDKAGLTFDDVDHYYFTQLNLRTIEFMMDLLKQPLEKAHWVMDKWGYTGSPCVVMALDDSIEQGKGPKPGDVILFCASGGGITMASSVWKWMAK